MARLLETARNLRRMGLFRRVAIDTGRVAGRFVVFVVTGDGWSTSLELNAKSTGGVFTWSTALTELNLLGTGNQASIGYRKDVDRNAIQGLAAVPRMFGTRVQGSGSYSAYSDGYETTELLGVPFRANSDRQSYAWSGDLARRLVYQFRDGNRTPTATYQRRTFRTAASATVYAGLSWRPQISVRMHPKQRVTMVSALPTSGDVISTGL